MKTIRGISLAVGLLGLPGMTWAGSAGTSGATVLNIPVGARAIGMGEAFTAMADNASSLYWNPAGIAILNQSEASFMYNPFMRDMAYHNASVVTPLENGGLGASLSYLSYGKIQGFDDAGNETGNVNAFSGVATSVAMNTERAPTSTTVPTRRPRDLGNRAETSSWSISPGSNPACGHRVSK